MPLRIVLIIEYLRPWKLVTFATGFAWLIWGAVSFDYPDWDIGISILMAGFTFLFAEWCIRVVRTLDWRRLPLVILASWWTIDGVYWAYWSAVDPRVMIRDGQWLASLMLFLLCGMVWTLDRSLRKSSGQPVANALNSTAKTAE